MLHNFIWKLCLQICLLIVRGAAGMINASSCKLNSCARMTSPLTFHFEDWNQIFWAHQTFAEIQSAILRKNSQAVYVKMNQKSKFLPCEKREVSICSTGPMLTPKLNVRGLFCMQLLIRRWHTCCIMYFYNIFGFDEERFAEYIHEGFTKFANLPKDVIGTVCLLILIKLKGSLETW